MKLLQRLQEEDGPRQTMHGTVIPMEFVNPDGPHAASLIVKAIKTLTIAKDALAPLCTKRSKDAHKAVCETLEELENA